ncbi:class I SAM-dependent methyltransferase [Oleomonas cavernae]|uniref:Class I SAM-dependent methyltransferase n=1 Tax=Oleomonas cavernae TaxID=2320859 RepID=A0A418W8W5_9PROT|nr:class I SAM-dependent methyltransferase [Oleomonas cavernae]RJF86455.1 class I SAM-dependent methyltransferase [Oleomonas cavernae]
MLPSVQNVFGIVNEDAPPELLLRMRCDSQSMSFYGDMSRFISQRIAGFETLSLLDVGPRTGAGLALLRLLHHPRAFTRLKLHPVAGIDLDPNFNLIADKEFKDIQALTGNIFGLPEKKFDIVTCSHTIEHLKDVPDFVGQLEKLARRYVVIGCPFEEREPMSLGHVQRIDQNFMNKLGFFDLEIYESNQFHSGLCCFGLKTL